MRRLFDSAAKRVAAMVLAAAVALTGASMLQPANAQPAAQPAPAQVKPPSYSDREVLAWLLAAAGPIAKEHPESLRYLGLTEATRPPVRWKELNVAMDNYLKYDKTFHRDVAVPMQSGDPIKTEQAFKVFTAHAKSYLALSETSSKVRAQAEATAAGKIGAKAKVAVYVVALANAVVYANAAVATNVAATLVLVWFYLMDESGGGPKNDFERQQFIAQVTVDLGR